jgi:hypothetical protein
MQADLRKRDQLRDRARRPAVLIGGDRHGYQPDASGTNTSEATSGAGRGPDQQGERRAALLQDHSGGTEQGTGELAIMVAELAAIIETTTVEPDAAQLRMRAQALAARIR